MDDWKFFNRRVQAGMAIAGTIDGLPGIELPKTYAAWPVWRDSVEKEVRFAPLPKKNALRVFYKAREFDRKTHDAGRHGGALGHAALQVLHALIFDFLNYRTGQLDPSYEGIAKMTNLARSTVAAALKRLRSLGILHWLRRRCRDKDGELAQDTNAYAILPSSGWKGFYEAPPAPPPHPSAWGAAPPIATAAGDVAIGLDPQHALEAEAATDSLAARLAALGRAIKGAKL